MNSDTSCTTDSSGDEKFSKHGKNCFQKRKLAGFISRPNAAPGFWLCCLLPLAFCTIYVKTPACAMPSSYEELVLAAIGMCVQSLCFFAYAFFNLGLSLDLFISCVPAVLTAVLYKWLLLQNWWWAAFWGFTVTYGYQQAYIRVMQELPRCFTYGECAIFVQGVMLFLLNASKQGVNVLAAEVRDNEQDIFQQLAGIMLFALTCVYIMCLLVYRLNVLQSATGFYTLLFLVVAAICCAPITKPLPLLKVLNFVLFDRARRLIVIFYAALVALTVLTVWLQLRKADKASTRMRKMFHLLVVLVYVPGILYECALLYLASGVALALFCVLELMRIFNIPPLGNTLKCAFASFSDDKDAGLLALTPFCLLIGCSLPLWISVCACSAHNNTLLPQLSGVLAVGFGDTAASVIGSKFGKRKWMRKFNSYTESARSKEGTLAFVIIVLLTVFLLYTTEHIQMTQGKWFVTIQATIITALVEAHTDQIDNLVLPLVFYIIVSLG